MEAVDLALFLICLANVLGALHMVPAPKTGIEGQIIKSQWNHGFGFQLEQHIHIHMLYQIFREKSIDHESRYIRGLKGKPTYMSNTVVC